MILASWSDYFDLNKLLGIMPNEAAHGTEIDHMLNLCHWFMTVLFVGWITYFFYTITRFHKSRNPKADYHGVRSHFSTHLEATVVIVEAVILLGFAIPLWGKRVNEIPSDQSGALRIRAIAYQFGWYFHYAGPDGKFASQNIRFIGGGNRLGLDPNDPNGADDAVVPGFLKLQLHRDTVVRVSSMDVIHGFCLPQMRVQQDATPGTEAPTWFRPINTGKWQIICAQLCGPGHFSMAVPYEVVTPADFDAWYKETQPATKSALDKQRAQMAEAAAAAAKGGAHGAPAAH